MTRSIRLGLPILLLVSFVACNGADEPKPSGRQRTPINSPTPESPADGLASLDQLFEPLDEFRFSDVNDPRAAQGEEEARRFMGDNLVEFFQKAARFRGRPIGLIQAFLLRGAPPFSETKSVVELTAQALGIHGEAQPLDIGDVGYILTDEQGLTIMAFTRKNILFSFSGGFPETARRLAGALVDRVDGSSDQGADS